MYLSRKQIAALEIALEAMESYSSASYNEKQNEAIDTIVAMLNSARRDVHRHVKKKDVNHEARQIDSAIVDNVDFI